MKTCPKCGAQMEENARFCLYCMTSLEQKTSLKISLRTKKVRWLCSVFCILTVVIALCGFGIAFSGKSDNSPKKKSPTNTKSHPSSVSENDENPSQNPLFSALFSSSSDSSSTEKTPSTSHQTSQGNETGSNISGQSGISSSSKVSSGVSSGTSTNSQNSSPSSSPSSSSTVTSSTVTSSTVTSSTPSAPSTDYYPESNFLKYAKYEIENGEATITGFTYSGLSVHLQIPSYIEGAPVTNIGYKAFSGKHDIKSVLLPSTLKTISSYAFFSSSITAVTIPEGVEKIGENAFLCCNSLTSVTLPKSITKLDDGAFSTCTKLTYIKLPENLKVLPSIIGGCEKLESIDLPQSITEIRSMSFANCSSLKTVKLPKLITNIPIFCFENCRSLKSVYIGKNVTKIESNAFQNCESLTDIYFEGSKADKEKITIGNENEALQSATWHYESY